MPDLPRRTGRTGRTGRGERGARRKPDTPLMVALPCQR